MKCAACLLALLLCFSPPLLAQESSTTSTAIPLTVSPSLSQQLDDLATKLELALNDSEADWDLLSSTLTSLSLQLEALAMSSRGLEQESASMLASLSSLEASLKASEQEARNRGLELWAWRIGTGAALGLAAWGWAR